MTELIGDICEPSVLIAPREQGQPADISVSGAIFISGGRLLFISGATMYAIDMTVE